MRANLMTMLLVLVLSNAASGDVAAASSPNVRISEVQEISVSEPVTVGGEVRARSDVILPALMEGELQWVAEQGSRVMAGAVVASVESEQLALARQEQALLADRAAISLEYLTGEVERLDALQQSNLASRTQLAELVSRRDLASNDFAVARARIAQLDDQLRRAALTSPFDGIVVERLLAGGEYARRGEGVLRIVDPTDMEIVITIPMTWLGRITDDQPVRVTAGSEQFDADLRALVGVGNAGSQTFTAVAGVPAQIAARVMSGQMVEVSVPLSVGRASLFVPRDAVVLRAEGSYVYRIDENNIATRISVALGEGQGDLVSVIGDLNAGDRIAIRGIERLADGQPVTPTQT